MSKELGDEMDDLENLEQFEDTEVSQDTEETIQIRNPRWNDLEHTSFDCELNHTEYGWIPFTVKGNDSSYYCSEIWKNKDSFEIQEFVPVQEDIEVLKEQKHQELRKERDTLRQIEFAEYNGANFQIRQEDQDNMNTFLTNAIGMLSGIITRENFNIMDADNILRTLTPEEIIELGSIMKSKVEEIYSRYWYARDVLLENAQTKEQISKITILRTSS